MPPLVVSGKGRRMSSIIPSLANVKATCSSHQNSVLLLHQNVQGFVEIFRKGQARSEIVQHRLICTPVLEPVMFTGHNRTIANPDAGADAYGMCRRLEFQFENHMGKGETSCDPWGVHSSILKVKGCRFSGKILLGISFTLLPGKRHGTYKIGHRE